MGLRDVFGRRRPARSADERPSPPVSRHLADPATGELVRVPGSGWEDAPTTLVAPRPSPAPRPEPAPAPVPSVVAPVVPPEVGGGLVVGTAELRRREAELPASYSADPPAFDRALVRAAFEQVAALPGGADRLVRDFYADLFLRLGRDAFTMFPASMSAQREDFGRALVQWVVADDPETLRAHLAQLGADHRKFDVQPRHYDVAAQALVGAWSRLLGERWTPEVEAAVVGSYTRLASTMIDGARASEDQPASWGATVVGHERVMRDFAVVRVQPDGPYSYRPGQYLTVELAQRPHEWRRMSVASAPRPDNTFDLHVRAVNATGVSAGLVMHTEVGDRLRIGPPRGNALVVEPGTLGPGGLLCLCSGTGAAPVTAVVESLLTWPGGPPVHVFVGGRTAGDLYPAEHLVELVQRAGAGDRVFVHGVVSRDPSWTGLRGKVEDVVPTLKDWAALDVDVLVAGSDTMIATAVFGLVGRGVRQHRIRFDQYEVTG